MKALSGCLILSFGVQGCTTLPRASPPVSTATSVAALATRVSEDSARSDDAPDSKTRNDLAADATRNADACVAREPQTATCQYARAVALGLEAHAHPTRAGELLNAMLQSLTNAEAADPNYDHAGPARVRALVLIRAPGWPLGPGDPEAGLAAGRRAAALDPIYAPNLLALAEALAKSGDAAGARENYQRAQDLVRTLPPSKDRDAWLREANQGLAGR